MTTGKKNIANTRQDLVKELAEYFPGNEAVSITRLILEHVGYTEHHIIMHPDLIPDPQILSEITKIVHELKKNRPIQYILGTTMFFDLPFFVDQHVLIPRPETEEMIQLILQENLMKQPRILDIGTGTGCIAISLAHYIPGSNVTAIDSEPGAIELAKRNGDHNHTKIDWICESIFELDKKPDSRKYDLIVSNPPYVKEEEKLMMHPRVTDHEPGVALFVPDDDPLIFYRSIASYAKKALNRTGALWVEINENAGEKTRNLFIKEGFENVRLMKDIHGKDRFIKALKQDG